MNNLDTKAVEQAKLQSKLSSIKGVGPRLSGRIARRFKSLECKLTLNLLLEVDGVDTELANRVLESLGLVCE